MKIQFAQVLRRYRHEKDMTQEELARAIGISPQSVSKWERGDGFPDISLLPEIANFFGISIDTLLGNDEESKRADIRQFWKSVEGRPVKEKVELALEYDKKYPDRYYIANYLVTTIMFLPREERAPYLSVLTKTCEKILENCTVERYRRRALESMCTVCPEEEFEKWYKHCASVYSVNLEVLEKRLWEQGKRAESDAAHQASDLMLMLHALFRPGRYDESEPEKMLAWCKDRIRLIEFFTENGEIPRFLCGAYALFHLRASCALFGCGRKEEGYDCLEKSFDLLEEARRQDVDQKIISLDGDPYFGRLKIDFKRLRILLPDERWAYCEELDNLRRPEYWFSIFLEAKKHAPKDPYFHTIDACRNYEFFDAVREEERFKELASRLPK